MNSLSAASYLQKSGTNLTNIILYLFVQSKNKVCILNHI